MGTAYFLSYICAKLFFGRVVVKDQKLVPKSGPLIFVANHRNMILDPGMVRYSCGRTGYYLAKHTLFLNKIQSWIFLKAGAIPVYRKQDDPNLTSKNKDTFDLAYNIFEEGKCLILFPEGISLAGRALFKIKTGAARIALNAELKNNFSLNLKIIPIGINYSDPSRFKSDVYIKYGTPISINEYKQKAADNFSNSVDDITHRIEESLLDLTTNLSFIDLDDVIGYLEVIYKNELFLENSLGKKKSYDDFAISKEIIDSVETFLKDNPEQKDRFITLTTKYMRFLEKLKLDDRFIVSKGNGKPKILPEKPLKAIWFVLQFPIYLYGLLSNILAYKISAAEVYTKSIDEVEIGQYKFFIGGAIFTLFYSLQTFMIYYFSGSILIAFIYFLLLIPTGNFALNYHNNIMSYLMQYRLFRIFSKRRDIITRLGNKRREIIDFIQEAKKYNRDNYVEK